MMASPSLRSTHGEGRLDGLGELEVERSLPYGGAYLLDWLWRRLGLDEVLQGILAERSFGHDLERELFALVANRALDPRSKLAVERWVGRRVAIDGLDEVPSCRRADLFVVDHIRCLPRRTPLAARGHGLQDCGMSCRSGAKAALMTQKRLS